MKKKTTMDPKLLAIGKLAEGIIAAFKDANSVPVRHLSVARRQLNKDLMAIIKVRRLPTREKLEATIAKAQAQLEALG